MGKFIQRLMIKMLPLTPGFLMWPVARRYIAGSSLADAVRTTRELNDLGATATLDILGEELRTLDEARDVSGRYQDALDAIHAEELRANISIKLSAFGIRIDPTACRELVVEVLTRAREYGTFVRFDMEDSTLTQPTLDLYRDLRPDFPNIGVVLQAMLKRTIEDARALAEEGARVRLVKGIYVEPEEDPARDPLGRPEAEALDGLPDVVNEELLEPRAVAALERELAVVDQDTVVPQPRLQGSIAPSTCDSSWGFSFMRRTE